MAPPARSAVTPAAAVPPRSTASVTELLLAWSAGEAGALDALMPVVYDELHRLAALAMRREAPGHTLQTTALVHEAYLRLVDQQRARWADRTQFYGVAAQLMRRILVDHARRRRAAKRGGALHVTHRDDAPNADASPASDSPVDVLALDDALGRLATLDPQQARVVELRYFGGLTIEATADMLGVSPATVKREWAVARAWLRRELSGG